MTLVEKTVLRGPDGRRWVVQTLRTADGYRTTARLTGCDLTPAGTADTATSDEAHQAHIRFLDLVARHGDLE
jgi:hypothetical protein